MKKHALIILLLLLTNICNSQVNQDSNFRKINLNKVSVIKLNYKNVKDTLLFNSGILNFFPNDYIQGSPLKLTGEGVKFISLKIQLPQKVDIYFSEFNPDSIDGVSVTSNLSRDFKTICFLIPNDTLEVELDFSNWKLSDPEVNYIGEYAKISEYYQDKQAFFKGIDFVYQKGLLANMEPNLEIFKNKIDEITKTEVGFLNEYNKKKELPGWFAKYETADIKYSSFGLKFSQPHLLEFTQGTPPPVSENYFSFLKELSLEDEDATLSIYYFLSLRDYIYHSLKSKQKSIQKDSTIKSNSLKNFCNFSDSLLKPYVSDVLIAREIQLMINFNHLSNIEFESLINNVGDVDLKNYLKIYKNKDALKPGDLAPYFYLKDETGKYFSLKDFKGSLVYLSFWFTGCKPCIKEFPDENLLVEVFKNERVKIISICLISDENGWKHIVTQHQLKTINLFAKGNWEDILQENYGITGFPHYVLINAEGKIIENNCIRPSQGAEQLIRNNLQE